MAGEKMEYLIRVLDLMIESCEPIKYDDFNKIIKSKGNAIVKAEEKHNQLGYKTIDGKPVITTLSIIATITDIFFGKRLAFRIDENGFIIPGFGWQKGDTEMRDKIPPEPPPTRIIKDGGE